MGHRIETPEGRAFHNWKDFFKEVVTIIVGVAIALLAGEVVDNWNWHREVLIVEDSLNDELADSLFAAKERIKIADCQRRTLDALDNLADSSSRTLLIKNMPVTRVRVWSSSAWDAAVASGAIAHMPHDTRNTYAVLFSFVHLFRDLNLRTEILWANVDAYTRKRTIDETSKSRFIESVAELRALTRTMNLAAEQFVRRAQPLNIKLDPADEAELQKPLQCPMP